MTQESRFHTISFAGYTKIRKRQNGTRSKYLNEDFFCWKWSLHHFPGEMLANIDQVPSDVDILKSVLRRKEFCVFLFESTILDSLLRIELLDFYGDDIDRLLVMWSWRKSLGSSVHISWGSGVPENASSNMRSFHSLLQKDGQIFWNKYRDSNQTPWRPTYDEDTQEGGGGEFADGLDDFVRARYIETMESGVEQWLRVLKLSDDEEYYDNTFLQSSRSAMRDLKQRSSIVFSVPGSGKTQHLFDYLSQCWGFYLVSGRVPRLRNSSETLLSACQGSASLDTRYLCEILDSIDNSELKYHEKVWSSLVSNRTATLSQIKAQLKRKGTHEFCERDWLLFQTTCTENFDIFLQTFQLRLMVDDIRFEDWKPGYIEKIFCLDEAQCELTDSRSRSTSPMGYLIRYLYRDFHLQGEPPFIASGTSLQLRKLKEAWQHEVVSVLRYELSDEDVMIDNDYLRDDIRKKLLTYETKTFSDFKLINEWNDFRGLLGRHIHRIVDKAGYLIHLGETTERYQLWEVFAIDSPDMTKKEFYRTLRGRIFPEHSSAERYGVKNIKKGVEAFARLFLTYIIHGRDEAEDDKDETNDVESTLSACSQIFIGRIQWSTLFIEGLLIAYLKNHEDTATKTIHNACGSAQKTIKNQLKSRITSLKDRDQHFLLQDLYITAVRADLMNKPTMFPNTESTQLVTEGFALLRASVTGSTSESKMQELAEPVTISAVVEYLRDSETENRRGNRPERILEQLLLAHQQEFSTVGNIAEYYLGWAFAGLLRKNTLQIFPDKKDKLLEAMGNRSKLILRDGGPFPSKDRSFGDMSNYYLEESSQGRPVKQENEPFHDWLDNILHEKWFPTIYFPPKDAGPDIVFMLRHQTESKRRILCALQVKTGLKGGEVFGLTRTLDPNLWFSGITLDNYQKLSKKLDEFGDDLEIMTGLVTVTEGNQVYSKGLQHLTELLQHLQDTVRIYTSLSTEENEVDRQKILQPLQSVCSNAIQQIDDDLSKLEETDKGTKDLKTRRTYWNLALDLLRKKNDPKNQTLGAQNLIRILIPDLHSKKLSEAPNLALFQNVRVTKGRNFYFAMIQANELSEIVGDLLGQLTKTLLSHAEQEKKKK